MGHLNLEAHSIADAARAVAHTRALDQATRQARAIVEQQAVTICHRHGLSVRATAVALDLTKTSVGRMAHTTIPPITDPTTADLIAEAWRSVR